MAPDAPSDLVSAVTRCLQKEPEARWPDVRSLREAVQWSGEEAELPPGLETLDGYGGGLAADAQHGGRSGHGGGFQKITAR